jgi:Flp pilus assembly protein TadD
MNTRRPFPPPRTGAMASATAMAMAMALTGCGAPGTHYPGAAGEQQRAMAEAAASPSAGAAKPGVAPGIAAGSRETYLRLVEQMQREGLWFASLAHLDALEQRWGRSPESKRLRADALARTGQPEQSRALYGELVGTALEGEAYHGLGLLAAGRADYVQAVQLLQQAQQRRPTDARLLSDLGYAQLRAGRVSEARVPLMQALQLGPDDPQTRSNVALYLLASQQPARAEALMQAHGMPAPTRAAVRAAARELTTSRRAGSTPSSSGASP